MSILKNILKLGRHFPNDSYSSADVKAYLQPIGRKRKAKNKNPYILTTLAAFPVLAFLIWTVWSHSSGMINQALDSQPATLQVMYLLILIGVLGVAAGTSISLCVKKITAARWFDYTINHLRTQRKMAVYVSGSGSLGFNRSLIELKSLFLKNLSLVVFSHPPISAVKNGGIDIENAVIATAPVQDAMGNLNAAIQGRSEEEQVYQEGHDKFMHMVGASEATVEWDILHLGEGHTSVSTHMAWSKDRSTTRVGADPARTVIIVRDRSLPEVVNQPLEIVETDPSVSDTSPTDLATSSIVQIVTPSRSGTGIVVDPDGFIITCAHVINEAESIEIRFPDGTATEATVVGQYQDSDISLIKGRGIKNAKPAEFTISEDVNLGTSVFAAGYPLQESGNKFKPTISRGTITGLQTHKNLSIIRSDVEIEPGFSGGGLFDQNGRLVGLITGQITEDKPNSSGSTFTCALGSDVVALVIENFNNSQINT